MVTSRGEPFDLAHRNISTKHVGTDDTHRDATDTLWLDGKATNPNP